MTNAITVDGLGKRYRLGHEVKRATSAREAVRNAASAPFRYLKYRLSPMTEEDTLWALKDISFEVKEGEVLGIIGANGAGKSTLLKILSRITDPTEGRAVIRGRVNALLEVGVGFNPELTGRENIYMNASLHGLTAREIRGKLDEIVDFAGVDRFLDTPVKRYSSGMKVRLGFAVAANLEPEVLIVDEVLAVGDISFQSKCLGKMKDVTSQGRTVLFVSHNMSAIENMCHRVMLLDQGRQRDIGEPHAVIDQYAQQQVGACTNAELKSEIATLTIRQCHPDGSPKPAIKTGDSVQWIFDLQTKRRIHHAELVVFIESLDRALVCTFHSRYQFRQQWSIQDRARIAISLQECIFAAGQYTMRVRLKEHSEIVCEWHDSHRFAVLESDFYGAGRMPNPATSGKVLIRADWQIDAEL